MLHSVLVDQQIPLDRLDQAVLLDLDFRGILPVLLARADPLLRKAQAVQDYQVVH